MSTADGGDLFDKISEPILTYLPFRSHSPRERKLTTWNGRLAAPDIGVDQEIAHLYFRQLIAGLVSVPSFLLLLFFFSSLFVFWIGEGSTCMRSHALCCSLYADPRIRAQKYLNTHGICHRDVKPENCLVDGNGP